MLSDDYRDLLDDLATAKGDLSAKQSGRKYMMKQVKERRKKQQSKAKAVA